MARNRLKDLIDDDREFTPEECERICNDALAAVEKSLKKADVPEGMREFVENGVTKLLAQMQVNMGLQEIVNGVHMREQIKAGVAMSDALKAFYDAFHAGVQACQAKGGTPQCT